jgi:hypothetical protein
MPVPAIVAGAAAVAGRLAAKKAAQEVAKKAASRTKIMSKATKKEEATKIAKTIAKKPEPSVKVVPARGKSFNAIKNQKETERLTRKPMPKGQKTSARPDSEIVKIKVSDNVTARVPAKSNYEFAKDMSRFGKIQKQNAGPLKTTKAEAKANTKALKAANKKGKK